MIKKKQKNKKKRAKNAMARKMPPRKKREAAASSSTPAVAPKEKRDVISWRLRAGAKRRGSTCKEIQASDCFSFRLLANSRRKGTTCKKPASVCAEGVRANGIVLFVVSVMRKTSEHYLQAVRRPAPLIRCRRRLRLLGGLLVSLPTACSQTG